MNIEKFIDAFGDDVYALALVCTKNFDSAADIFLQVAAQCREFHDNAGMFEIASIEFPLCKKAKCSDSAETLSGIGLTKKQEILLSEIFPRPQISRTVVHLFYENDLSAEQISEITGEPQRYVSEQLAALGDVLSDELEENYKELCLRLIAPDELKSDAVLVAQSGEKRAFEVREEPTPRHIWTKKQKIAAVIFAVIAGILLYIVIPIISEYIDQNPIFGEDSSEVSEALVAVPPE